MFFFEEGILNGGIGETFWVSFAEKSLSGRILPQRHRGEAFVPQASVKKALMPVLLDEKGMENIIYGVENRE